MKELARIIKAMADETRLQMLALIVHDEEVCVCDCMQVLGISQSKASRHLRYLANAGLLDDRRDGTWVYYRVAKQLDADRGVLLDAARALLTAKRVGELLELLVEWKQQKDGGREGVARVDEVMR